MELNSRIQAILTKAISATTAWFNNLSSRERLVVIVAPILLLAVFVPRIFENISLAFSRQSRAVIDAERDRKQVLLTLSRYASLKARREAIEREYKEVEIKEGVLSYLESLIKSKAGVTHDLLKELPVVKVGTNYEQAPFAVRFSIGNMNALVAFLDELVAGAHPLMLKKLDLKKASPDKLSVDLEVVSIREASKGDES